MKNILKFAVAWGLCTLIRLIPGRPANFEPILAMNMPFSRRMGSAIGFMFAFSNMVLFDVITGHLGIWTAVTALTYGLVGAVAPLFFSKVKTNVLGYISYSVLGILFFDLVTGVIAGPLLFGGSYIQAFIGQIPFTLNHLAGGVFFAATLSPLVDKWIVSNPKLVMKLKFA